MGRIAEPLDKTLENEFADRLCSITFVVKVVECNAKELYSLCSSRGVGAAKEVSVSLMDRVAVRASVVLEVIVSVDFMSSW